VSNPVADAESDAGDAGLIEQAKSGSLEAFDRLVRAHQREVFAVAMRMLGDRDEAEDIAQEAFIRAYRGFGAFRGGSKFSTWLVAITMNLCRNRRRWWARRRRVIAASLDAPGPGGEDSPGLDAADPSPEPAHAAQSRELEGAVLESLQRLDEAHRVVVVLRDLEGYSYEEIARMAGCRVGTVKSRLSRARRELRACLDGKL